MKYLIISLIYLLASCSSKVVRTKTNGIEQLKKACVNGPVKGIDVSHFTGEIDWPTLKKNQRIDFVMVKVSEGIDMPDETFHKNFENARAHGLAVGGYHFYITADSAVDQLALIKKHIGKKQFDLPFVVDVEHIGHGTKKGFKNELKLFLKLVEEYFGETPIVYTSPNFWRHKMKLDIHKYPLWIAQYGVKKPVLPRTEREWVFWQYEGEKRLASVEKDVDFSYFNCL